MLKILTGSENWTEHKELVHSECICRVGHILLLDGVVFNLSIVSKSALQSPETVLRALPSREEARMFLCGLSVPEKSPLILGWNLIRMEPQGAQRVS